MTWRFFFIIWLGFVFFTDTAFAHEIRSVFMNVEEAGGGLVNIHMRLPARNGRVLDISPSFPDNCTVLTGPTERLVEGAGLREWTLRCPGGIVGGHFALPHLSNTMTDALVQISLSTGERRAFRLTSQNVSFTLGEKVNAETVTRTYTLLGFKHILSGYDHLLFILGLFFLVDTFRKRLAVLTGFTLSHSLSLLLASMEVIHVPGPLAEALIALSLITLAKELILKHKGKTSLIQQYPGVIVFCFGLVHGLGFAGALGGIGLVKDALLWSILFFNLGIEIGQLAVILGLTILASVATRLHHPSSVLYPAAAYLIGTMGALWSFARIASFSY